MNIKEVKTKSIVVKSGLPGSDFVINPYIGCSHGCIYCYARFMKRFTNHSEEWGNFVDVKINGPELISENIDKYKNKTIVIGSVTDPYLPLEKKYEITRKILKKLIPHQPELTIMTKSDLIIRDIDLLKQFNNCTVSISFSSLNEKIRKELEPGTIPLERKLEALEELYKKGIKTVLFISPIIPEITDWKQIINKTKNFVNEYWFENLNLYPSIRNNISSFLKKYNLDLLEKYKEIYFNKNDYWDKIEEEIKEFCKEEKVNYKIYFHHNNK